MDIQKKIHEKANNFELYVFMYDDKLEIKLKFFTHESRKNYQTTLIQDNLPSDIQANLDSLQNIFECLSLRQNYQVKIDTQQLFIKTTHIIGKKQKIILTKIKLEQVLLSELENLSYFVRQLASSIQNIKEDIKVQVDVSLQLLWEKKKQEILQQVKEVINNKIRQAKQNEKDSIENYLRHKKNDLENKQIQQIDERMKKIQEKNSSITLFEKRLSFLQKKNQDKIEKLNKRVQELQNQINFLKRSQDNISIVKKQYNFRQVQIIGSDSNRNSNSSQCSSLAMINQQQFSHKSKNNSSFLVPNSQHFTAQNQNTGFKDIFQQNTQYVKNFLFDQQNRSITFNCQDFNKESIQLLCKQIIPKNQQYIFSVKILKAKKASIFIGVINKNLQKNVRSSYKSGNAMVFYGGGRIWYGPQSENKFFETKEHFGEGDEVMTIVDRENQKITWKVNGFQAGSLINKQPRFDKNDWVPYFEFKSKGDIIKWLN